MQKKTLIFTVGISASGKSTWAKEQVALNPAVKQIERDMIRRDIMEEKGLKFSWLKWDWSWEDLVTERWNTLLEGYISQPEVEGVILSDTNLNKGRLKKRISEIESRWPDVSVEVKLFHVSFEEAIQRDNARQDGVGYAIISEQLERFQKSYGPAKVEFDPSLPKCIVVDLDGTLAIHNGRSPYDYSRCDEDLVDPFLKITCQNADTYDSSLVILTGRPESSRLKTEDWLLKNGITPSALLMRSRSDRRPDFIVKEELLRDHVLNKYSVIAVFEDRPRNVRMFNKVGVRTFAVGNPYIEF